MNDNIERKVQEAMNSLDGVQKTGPGPFFFTRVQARLQGQRGSGWEKAVSVITRPSIALTGLCLIILLNAVAFYFHPAAGSGALALSAGSNDPGYADDYGNLATNFFYDENPEP
jgi:hypothetical protein